MFKSKSILLIITAGLLLLLILVSALWPLLGGDRMLMTAGGLRGGRNADGMTPPQGDGNFDPNNMPQPQGTFVPGDNANGQGSFTPGDRPQGGFSPSNTGLSTLWRILQNILYVVELALGILAIVGIWLKKQWGIVLGIIVASVIFIFTIVGMFRMFTTIAVIENIVKCLLAVAVIVLSLLPRTRRELQAVTE